jgi:hypothetical protein
MVNPLISLVPGAGIEPDPLPYYQGFRAIDLQHTYNLGHSSQDKIHTTIYEKIQRKRIFFVKFTQRTTKIKVQREQIR